MTINVHKERTLVVPGIGGRTLLPGQQDHSPVVEKTFVDARFAEYVENGNIQDEAEAEADVESKMQDDVENKMHPGADENKEPKTPPKRGRGRPRKVPVDPVK